MNFKQIVYLFYHIPYSADQILSILVKTLSRFVKPFAIAGFFPMDSKNNAFYVAFLCLSLYAKKKIKYL